MNKLTHFSLFTGIGGIDLSAEWAGFETVGQCEWADFPTKVLEKHWPDVPRWRDIRSVTKEDFERRTGRTTVDLVSGGFPCQPFSVAGKKKGEDDDRYLWPEMLRVISELQPTWVLGENVAGIIDMALDQVCSDLEDQGYQVQTFVIPATGVSANHRRKRVFIVAYANSIRVEGCPTEPILWKPNLSFRQIGESFQIAESRFNTFESRLCRSLHGIPNGVDRVKALGNAVVPQQVYPILKAIAEIEKGVE